MRLFFRFWGCRPKPCPGLCPGPHQGHCPWTLLRFALQKASFLLQRLREHLQQAEQIALIELRIPRRVDAAQI